MSFQPRTADVLIYEGDDPHRLGQLLTAAQDAPTSDAPLLAGEVAPSEAARDEYNAFLSEAKARALTVRLTALSRLQWRDLCAQHPARGGVSGDEALGVNEDTFGPELIRACWRDETVPNRSQIVDDLRQADFDTVLMAAWTLNKAGGFNPKALPGFALMRSPGEM